MSRPRLPYRLPRAHSTSGELLFILLLALILASFCVSQIWAARFGYHAELGSPLFTISRLGPVYAPHAWMTWRTDLLEEVQADPRLRALLEDLNHLLLTAGLAALLVAGLFTMARGSTRGDVHGSARPATSQEIQRLGLRSRRSGVVIGGERRFVGPFPRYRHFHAPDHRHVGIFGPSGCGKTTKLIIPTLLQERRSMVVLDIKRELHHLTAEARRRMGHTVHAFAPSIDEPWVSGYNPLLDIPQGPQDVAYAQALAEALINPDGKLQAPDFWHASAQSLLVAGILHVLYTGTDKQPPSLARVLHLLAPGGKGIQEQLRAMSATEHDPAGDRGWVHPAWSVETKTHPAVFLETAKLLDLAPETLTGIVATARSRLNLFLDPILSANTTRHDFSLSDLGDPNHPTTLYLILPARDIPRLAGFLRLFLQMLAFHLTGGLAAPDAQGNPAQGRELVLCLDELAAVGRLDLMARQIAFLRGYGVQVIAAVQTANQLYDLYGQHEAIRGNLSYLVVFPSTEHRTAEEISRLLGDQTVYVESRSRGTTGHLMGHRRTDTLRDQKRPLLTPDEVRRLGDDRPVLFVTGAQPVFCRMVGWWRMLGLRVDG